MSRQRRVPAAAALVAMVVLISACGSSGPGSSSASGSAAAEAQTAVKFAECMRSHGVPQFPDPSAGKFTLDGVVNGSSLNPNAPAFTRALSACEHLAPAGFAGGRRSHQQMVAALRFARCIRANGVTDFPDPINGQPLVDTNRIPSTATSSGMTILRAAMRTCSAFGVAAGARG